MSSPNDRHSDVTSPSRQYVTSSVYAVSSPQQAFAQQPITVGSRYDVIVGDVAGSGVPLVGTAGQSTPLVRSEVKAFFSNDDGSLRESGSGGILKSEGAAASPRFVFELGGTGARRISVNSTEGAGVSPGGGNFVVKSGDGLRVTHLTHAVAEDEKIAPNVTNLSPNYIVTSRHDACQSERGFKLDDVVDSDCFRISSRAIPTDVSQALSPMATNRELSSRVYPMAATDFNSSKQIRLSSSTAVPPPAIEKQVSIVVHSVNSASRQSFGEMPGKDETSRLENSSVKSEISVNVGKVESVDLSAPSSGAITAENTNSILLRLSSDDPNVGVISCNSGHDSISAEVSAIPESGYIPNRRKSDVSKTLDNVSVTQDKMAADQQDGGHVESESDGSKRTVVPVFDRKLKSASVGEGGGASLSCHVTACPAAVVRWEKDGKAITGDNKNIEIMCDVTGTQTLRLARASLTDAGRYVCVARSEAGEARTMASLMVGQAGGPGALQAPVGGAGRVNDFRAGLHPRPLAQPLKPSFLTPKEPASPSPAAGPAPGPSPANRKRPEVLRAKPEAEFLIGEQRVEAGQGAELRCRVRGQPPPKVCWFHDKDPVRESETCHVMVDEEGGVHSLVLDDITPAHAGRYVCKAENQFGLVRASCTLLVHGAPQHLDDRMDPQPSATPCLSNDAPSSNSSKAPPAFINGSTSHTEAPATLKKAPPIPLKSKPSPLIKPPAAKNLSPDAKKVLVDPPLVTTAQSSKSEAMPVITEALPSKSEALPLPKDHQDLTDESESLPAEVASILPAEGSASFPEAPPLLECSPPTFSPEIFPSLPSPQDVLNKVDSPKDTKHAMVESTDDAFLPAKEERSSLSSDTSPGVVKMSPGVAETSPGVAETLGRVVKAATLSPTQPLMSPSHKVTTAPKKKALVSLSDALHAPSKPSTPPAASESPTKGVTSPINAATATLLDNNRLSSAGEASPLDVSRPPAKSSELALSLSSVTPEISPLLTDMQNSTVDDRLCGNPKVPADFQSESNGNSDLNSHQDSKQTRHLHVDINRVTAVADAKAGLSDLSANQIADQQSQSDSPVRRVHSADDALGFSDQAPGISDRSGISPSSGIPLLSEQFSVLPDDVMESFDESSLADVTTVRSPLGRWRNSKMTSEISEVFDSELDMEQFERGGDGGGFSGGEEQPLIEDLEPESVSVVRGGEVELRGTFVGRPLPTATWLRGSVALEQDARILVSVEPLEGAQGVAGAQGGRGLARLRLRGAEPGDTGCYTLVLTNPLGTDRLAASVTVEDRPDPHVAQPAVTSVGHKSVVLSWYGSSYDGGCPITRYLIELCECDLAPSGGGAGEGEWAWRVVTDSCQHTTHKVTNLKPDTAYRFRVRTGNKHGFSEPGQASDKVITTGRVPSRSVDGSLDNLTSCDETDDDVTDPNSPVMLDGPLSPVSLLAAKDEMPFPPREVKLDTERNFADFYSVGEEIGKGKFGSVCMCMEKSSNREFAAKFIRVKAGQREDFRKEVDVMNQLRHPKILLLWDAFESSHQIIIVMEHVAGKELLERVINDDYILTERECVHFMRQICEGVRYMHTRNILHLDLKPENILCVTTNSNEIKIIDFGLARKFDPTKSVKVMFGTPEFVAPEVINYDEISYTTDLWSIGVICYVLLSGLSPMLGDTDEETLANVTSAQYDFDDDAFDEISTDAKEFIGLLLLRDPKKRLSAAQCLQHRWLSQDVSYMRAKRLSTAQHKKYMARRKWQKSGNALRALGRMSALQRRPSLGPDGKSPRGAPGGKASSVHSDTGVAQLSRPLFSPARHVRTLSLDYKANAAAAGNLSIRPANAASSGSAAGEKSGSAIAEKCSSATGGKSGSATGGKSGLAAQRTATKNLAGLVARLTQKPKLDLKSAVQAAAASDWAKKRQTSNGGGRTPDPVKNSSEITSGGDKFRRSSSMTRRSSVEEKKEGLGSGGTGVRRKTSNPGEERIKMDFTRRISRTEERESVGGKSNPKGAGAPGSPSTSGKIPTPRRLTKTKVSSLEESFEAPGSPPTSSYKILSPPEEKKSTSPLVLDDDQNGSVASEKVDSENFDPSTNVVEAVKLPVPTDSYPRSDDAIGPSESTSLDACAQQTHALDGERVEDVETMSTLTGVTDAISNLVSLTDACDTLQASASVTDSSKIDNSRIDGLRGIKSDNSRADTQKVDGSKVDNAKAGNLKFSNFPPTAANRRSGVTVSPAKPTPPSRTTDPPRVSPLTRGGSFKKSAPSTPATPLRRLSAVGTAAEKEKKEDDKTARSDGTAVNSPRRRFESSLTTPAKTTRPKKPPIFVRRLRNLDVLERSSARFEVLVDGFPDPAVTWFKDGKPMEIKQEENLHAGDVTAMAPPTPKYAIGSGEDGRAWLVINQCGEDDDAEYSCRATNQLGDVTSKAELYVEPFGEQLLNHAE